MEFKKLTESEMEMVVSTLLDEKVVFQSDDCHGYYFDSVNGEFEVKMVTDEEDYSLHQRNMGMEDWLSRYDIEVTDAVIQEIIRY